MLPRIDGPRLPSAAGHTADRLIVFCHGYGADGNDLIGLGAQWQRQMPGAAFVSPHAPERCAMSAGGYQWFPIARMEPAEMMRGVQSAAPILDAFLDRELERLNLDASRLALVGFSQGTMMALHVGLRRKTPPAAILGYSGALAAPERLGAEATGKPPIMLIHGDQDSMIPVQALFAATQALGAYGVPLLWHISRGVGHGIDPEGLELGGRFLGDAFSGKLKSAQGAAGATGR
jgi:phospholipase/carboxylesterase